MCTRIRTHTHIPLAALMEYYPIILLSICFLLPGSKNCFSIDTKNAQIIQGPKETQFGYTVQQHEALGQKWLLVGAPFEKNGENETGDVYKCPLGSSTKTSCSRLNLGETTLKNVFEHKDKMRLGMSLTSNPKDNSFVACGPLWSYECGSSLYSTGICSSIDKTFNFSHSIAPAFQRCETYLDIVIVLDGSNSIYPWFEVRYFLINVLQKFAIGPGQIQVGVVQYGERVVHEFHLNDYQTVDEVVSAAYSIIQRGGEETRTALGINVARSQAFKRGGRPDARKVMIVITDGESHDSPDLKKAVEDSEKDNITLYGIAVLGYYNRRGINPEAFLREIKFIATDPEEHFFSVTDESALKDIVDALGEKIFSLEGTSQNGTAFGLQMSQAGFSSHIVEDGVLVGAVGAYEWNGAVLKQTQNGNVIPPKASYLKEFPEELKNHGAYLGYVVSSIVSAHYGQLYVAGAPRYNHTGKVIIFTLTNVGNLTILHSLTGQQIGSYYGSELTPLDQDEDGLTDLLLVAAPMFFSKGWETGRVYIYRLNHQGHVHLEGFLEPADWAHNSRFGSAMSSMPDLNGDGYGELVVGAPLEDDHSGAIYLFYSRHNGVQPKYKQRIAAADISSGLQYFGRSVHGALDINGDGLADLSVGALGAAVILWSRCVVRVHLDVHFEPSKINVFNKDCVRGGKEVTCMAAKVCVTVKARTLMQGTQSVALKQSWAFDERRYSPRAVLDNTDAQSSANISVLPDTTHCEHIHFHVHETTDYTRPVVFNVDVELQNPDEGPVLDDGWSTSLRLELPFWNGCEEEDQCVPNLMLQSSNDLLDHRQFCAWRECATCPLCVQTETRDNTERVIETSRRRVLVEVRLENRGENAYNTQLHISHSANLQFSGLMSPPDVEIKCETTESLQRNCSVSGPLLRSLAQVSFRLELEISRSVFLDYMQVLLKASSDGEEINPEDNINNIYHPLIHEADILFTRDSSPVRFQIKSVPNLGYAGATGPTFNLSYQLQNLGLFPVSHLLLTVDVFSVTKNGNHLLYISDINVNQNSGSQCTVPRVTGTDVPSDEDLSLTPQLNLSTAGAISAQCRLMLQPQQDMSVTVAGRLNLHTLQQVNFKALELVIMAAIELRPNSPVFLHEERPTRHIILEIRKDEDYKIPIWIIIGSTLGGLQLLALLVLALWKLGFFHRERQREEDEKTTEQR
ncbi:integrin alpha-11 isoform X2 [Clarias gariepinus]|uniref:integrin alpha-11 isoform X2 n=1 Tax=Clarias gariepinus TaxID=13013 RepID=UPI00234D9246|nr:integrin alpha-11 isoform X2 [Clarias gariepinus]